MDNDLYWLKGFLVGTGLTIIILNVAVVPNINRPIERPKAAIAACESINSVVVEYDFEHATCKNGAVIPFSNFITSVSK